MSKSFIPFDSTLGSFSDPYPPLVEGVPSARKATWISSTWMTRDGATLDPSYATEVANVLANGGTLHVTKPDGWDAKLTIKPEHASMLDILDFESWIYDYKNMPTIISWLINFKKAQPGLKVGFYPTQHIRPPDVPPLAVNTREDLITKGKYRSTEYPTWLQQAYIKHTKEFNEEFFNLLDFLSPDFYLLGPLVFDRDIAFFDAVVNTFSTYNKPLYPFVWGIWHTGFNGPTVPPITETQMTKYVQWLIKKTDGCIVWGEKSHNEHLWDVIAREVDGFDRPAFKASTTVRTPVR